MAASDLAVTLVLLVALTATGFASAAALRLPLASTLLAAYVAIVGEATLLTTALSPFRLVTRTGLAIGEALLLVAALAVWQRRGRPLPSVGGVRTLLRAFEGNPVLAVLFIAVAVSLLYELVLGLTVPPDNWDSLTYHLTRAAAWAQHGGVYWIPHAPTDRINEFQPLAEQQILFLFVATGEGALYALPQFVAELALITAIYTSARRLGSDVRQAMCCALFFAALPLVALEATTAQNDLVAAALVTVAAALLLGSCRVELVLAGGATALALGVKLTTGLVLPVLAVLALARGRPAMRLFALAGAATFVLLGIWGFVLNLVHTGHVLGRGGGRVALQASPSLTGSPATAFRVLYNLLDLSGLSLWALVLFAVLGIFLALRTFVLRRRGKSPVREACVAAAVVALPLLAPGLVPAVGHAFHAAANAVSLPVEAPASTGSRFFWGISYRANEDLSAFGPLAGPVLVAASVLTLIAVARRRVALRVGALGLALPLFIVLLALTSKYDPWLSRFLLVPTALGAPLFAPLFRRRDVGLAVVIVTVGGLLGTQVHNELKPLLSSYGYAWQLTQVDAAKLTWQPGAGPAIASLDQALPGSSCVGAVLGLDDAAYPIFGSHLERKVVFLPRLHAVSAAARDRLHAVVIGHVTRVAASFAAAGWRIQDLPASRKKRYWRLAIDSTANPGRCSAS